MRLGNEVGALAVLTLLSVAGCGGAQESAEAGLDRARQELQSGPDLVITAVSTPPSVQVGQSFTTQVTVCNQGTTSAGVELLVLLSADATLVAPPSDDRLVGTARPATPLPAQECITLPVTGNAQPPQGASSAVYVGAMVNAVNSASEIDKTNNSRVGTRMGLGSLADFVITSVTGPAQVMSGQSLTAQVTVCNQGTVSASTNVAVYLSLDATIRVPPASPAPSDDRRVGGIITVPTLSAGQCTTLPITGSASLPSAPPSNEYAIYIGGVVDPNNQRPELIEDNNTYTGSRIGVGNRPDFVITSVTGPVSVDTGQSFTTKVTVCNQGSASASTEVAVLLSRDATLRVPTSSPTPDDDKVVGSSMSPMLSPGQCTTLPVACSAYPPAGPQGNENAFYLGGAADPGNQRPEFFKDNNTATGGRIGVGYRPDFVITSVTAPPSVQGGQSLTAQVTVCNQGTASASTLVEVFLSRDATIVLPTSSALPEDDKRVGMSFTPTIHPGQCTTLPVTGNANPPQSPLSAFYIGGVVDPGNQRPELIEDNNTHANSRIGVGSLADFVVTAVTAPPSVQPGQSLTAQVTVCNQGSVSGNTPVEVYLSSDATLRLPPAYPPGDAKRVGGATSPTLNPGQCFTLPVTGSASPPQSSQSAFYISGVADPGKLRPELIEDNNIHVSGRIGLGSLADFVITSVTGSRSMEPGQSFTVEATVCNQGTVSNSTNVDFYLSADTTLRVPPSSGAGEDVPLGTTPPPPLSPGQCVKRSRVVSASPPPTSNPQEPLYLGAVVDPSNQRPELIEDNNVKMDTRIFVGHRSDFVITSVTGPTSAQPGQSVTTQVTVCNQGTAGDSTDVAVYLSADATIRVPGPTWSPNEDAPLGTSYTPYLSPGQCTTLPVTGNAYPPPAGGSAFSIGGVVDPYDYKLELAEDNNATTGNRIGVGSGADFVVTAVTGPPSVQVGQSLTAQVTVCNQGNASDSTDVEVYLSVDATIGAATPYSGTEDTLLGSVFTSMLVPGQCITLPVTGNAYPPYSQGPYGPSSAFYIGGVVDPRGNRPELIEDNNATAGRRIGVGDGADFVVTSVTSPPSVQPGQSLTTQVTVCNQGTASGGTDVEVYLSADTTIRARDPYTGPVEDAPLGIVSTPMLSPGQCATLPITGSAMPPYQEGPYGPVEAFYVGAMVDPGNHRLELIEDNNATAGSRIGVGYKADFVITSVTGPTSVRMGNTFTASVTLCNQGQSSDSASVELYLSADTTLRPNSGYPSEDFFLGTLPSVSLVPGACTTRPITVPANVPSSGSYFLVALANPFNGFNELIPDNNTAVGNALAVTP